jgi:hypothetical protein
MATTTRHRRLISGFLWLLGGFFVFRFLISNDRGTIPTRLSESAASSGLSSSADQSPVVVETGGQWFIAMVQTVLGWIGSLMTVALVFAVIAIAVMLLTDWGGKRK